jgi:DNA-binding Xre family transcriptional regulator
MGVSYNKLWKLLVDKKMSKADLRKASGISPNTIDQAARDEPVMLNVLDKICYTLAATTAMLSTICRMRGGAIILDRQNR